MINNLTTNESIDYVDDFEEFDVSDLIIIGSYAIMSTGRVQSKS